MIIAKFEQYLQTVMHVAAQALMIPVMIILVLLILYALYCVGSLIAEYYSERKHFKVTMAESINAIWDAPYGEIEGIIEGTALLNTQKHALLTVAGNMGLPDDDLYALAKSAVSELDARYRKIVSRTELVTKIAPMMGLMCTLIPLGPGIVAMGVGEVNTLSNSLLVAFDGTVSGLVAAVVAMCVSSVRKRWYNQYLTAVESLMSTLLEKAEEARKEGVDLPCKGDIPLPPGTKGSKDAGEHSAKPAAAIGAAVATAVDEGKESVGAGLGRPADVAGDTDAGDSAGTRIGASAQVPSTSAEGE